MKLSRGTLEALSLGSFVALDIETTGLDPEKDEIIEIGIVRVEGGDIVDRFQQLFSPHQPISPFITQLTGIRPEDCQNQPHIEEKIDDIIRWTGKYWIVAHNAVFDITFLKNACRASAHRMAFSDDRILDTLELSRILLYDLPNHRLNTLAEELKLPSMPEHRALADAEATAHLFLSLIPESLGLSVRALDWLNRLLSPYTDALSVYVQNVQAFTGRHSRRGQKKHHSRKDTGKRSAGNNLLGSPLPVTGEPEILPVDLERVRGQFEAGGLLSCAIPQYEVRKPQMEMAFHFARALNQESFLVAEAGTGVGKSLAYLVAVKEWITRNPQCRVLVSTNTKTLQDQLFRKELPLLLENASEPFLSVLLKGRANYLCLYRWQQMIALFQDTLFADQIRRLLPLVVWADETRTGDIEENAGFQAGKNSVLWYQLNSDSARCQGSQCVFAAECYFQKVRRAARSANILVVNHSLVFSDIASGYTVLGDYDTIVIDEAHQIEKVATSCLGQSLSIWKFRDLIQRLYWPEPKEVGLLIMLGKSHDLFIKHPGNKEARELQEKLIQDSRSLWQAAVRLFQGMGTRVITGGRVRGIQKVRMKTGDALMRDAGAEITEITDFLDTLEQGLIELSSLLMEKTSTEVQENDWMQEIESLLQQFKALRELTAYFGRGDYSGQIVWYEVDFYMNESQVNLYTAPLDIATLLSDMLYPRLERCLLTSATMTVGGEFDYILHRLGLDRLPPDRVVKKVFGSPFNFEEQALLIVPTFLASPKEGIFTSDVSGILERILRVHERGTLVLFTSYQMLDEVYQKLLPVLEERGVLLLAQRGYGARTALLKTFQEHGKSVLLGTSSFWEGVDVPGEALETLVITKIPFDVPSEPLVEARMEQVQLETGNGFLNYAVPEAVVRFRQGFGRLIRTGEDRGVVLILDNRVVKSSYGALFLDSLPVRARICEDETMLMHLLEEWFNA